MIHKLCSTILVVCLLAVFLDIGWELYKLTHQKPIDANGIQIAVLFDGNSYTCKLNDFLADIDLNSYKEALDYCEKWKQNLLEYRQRSKRSWKEVQGGVY
jgi:hypothetical protein